MKLHELMMEYLGVKDNPFARYLLFVSAADRPEFDYWLLSKGYVFNRCYGLEAQDTRPQALQCENKGV